MGRERERGGEEVETVSVGITILRSLTQIVEAEIGSWRRISSMGSFFFSFFKMREGEWKKSGEREKLKVWEREGAINE